MNMVELGRALNALEGPPVKALFVYNSTLLQFVPTTTKWFAD